MRTAFSHVTEHSYGTERLHLLTIDVRQFYPSLYTHAGGWAVNPKLRERQHWRNRRLLGKQIDQALMDMQGKLSQGIPIGTDISYLLAETVLAQVDRSLGLSRNRAYRWFDDYEIACSSREEAERLLAKLSKELQAFNLRLNPTKTKIVTLPVAIEPSWRAELIDRANSSLTRANSMVEFFDAAFSLRTDSPFESVLM